MPKLSVEDRRQLLRLLESMRALQTFEGRYQALEAAGLESVIPQINLEGETSIVIGAIVGKLEQYGRLTYDHEALGLFLSAVKEFLGAANENRRFINSLLTRYLLMIPMKDQPPVGEWKTGISPTAFGEKIIGENTLRNVAFLQRGLDVSRAVVFIDAKEWVGTGFMASPCLLFTNHHVLPTREIVARSVFRFNYQLTFDGHEERVQEYKPRAAGLFHTCAELDYSLVETEGTPGTDWGIAPLSSDIPLKDSRVNIIQHPGGLPKQISFQNNFVQYADATKVQYLTSTLNGSSGSPVFNDKWEVIAVHHAGGELPEPGTELRYLRNEGIAIGTILDNLPREFREQLKH